MANPRLSFAKREREMKLKDRARAKAERRAAKRAAKGGDDAPGTGEDVTIDAPIGEDGALAPGAAPVVASGVLHATDGATGHAPAAAAPPPADPDVALRRVPD